MRCWHRMTRGLMGLAVCLAAVFAQAQQTAQDKKAGGTPTPREGEGPASPGAVAPQTQPAAARPALRAKVDPRVELMSIIFRLAGNPEYNAACSTSSYSYDVDKHFGRFVTHAVVLKAKELRAKRGIALSAVTSLAVHVVDAVDLQEKVSLDRSPPRLDEHWKPDEAREFLELARQFVKDADFAAFIDAHRPLYTASAIRMNQVLRRYDIRRWLDEYFGVQPTADYSVIVGLLVGGWNYGMSVQFPDGREEITPVIGCAHFDDHGIPLIDDSAWLPVIVHEFCHPYSNPLFEKNPEPFRKAAQKLLSRHRATLQSQAYGSWQAVICETLVRASVIRYLDANHGPQVARKDMDEQKSRSFLWLPGLCKELERYERQRDKYPTFEHFLPEIAKYLDEYAARP